MPVAESTSVTTSPQKTAGTSPRLNHLRLLEAESIHILREVASEFERPVMLYSIGKDSSVMLRLAQKAFYPAPIPFPLLHIDTGFKFAEMLAFRDEMARKVGAELLVWRNEPAIAAGTNPIVLDTKRCCGLLKTQALLDALRHYNFDAAFRRCTARRREVAGKGAYLLLPRWRWAVGPEESAARALEPLQRAHSSRRKHSCISHFQLDGDGRLAVHPRGKIPVVDLYFAKERPMYLRGDALLPTEQAFCCASRREAADGQEPAALAGCSPAPRHPLRCRQHSGDHCGADLV